MENMSFKRGSTFLFTGTLPLTDAEGTPIDGTGWSITSEIRQSNERLIAPLVVDWIAPADRTFAVEFYGDTSSWPLGSAKWDMRIAGPQGQVIYTQTVQFLIVERVTDA